MEWARQQVAQMLASENVHSFTKYLWDTTSIYDHELVIRAVGLVSDAGGTAKQPAFIVSSEVKRMIRKATSGMPVDAKHMVRWLVGVLVTGNPISGKLMAAAKRNYVGVAPGIREKWLRAFGRLKNGNTETRDGEGR